MVPAPPLENKEQKQIVSKQKGRRETNNRHISFGKRELLLSSRPRASKKCKQDSPPQAFEGNDPFLIPLVVGNAHRVIFSRHRHRIARRRKGEREKDWGNENAYFFHEKSRWTGGGIFNIHKTHKKKKERAI